MNHNQTMLRMNQSMFQQMNLIRTCYFDENVRAKGLSKLQKGNYVM